MKKKATEFACSLTEECAHQLRVVSNSKRNAAVASFSPSGSYRNHITKQSDRIIIYYISTQVNEKWSEVNKKERVFFFILSSRLSTCWDYSLHSYFTFFRLIVIP